MLTQHKLLVTLALFLSAIPASAGSLVYVVTGAQQFGTIDLSTGAFTTIGPGTPEGETGLVQGPGGSLLTLTFAGNLDAITPSTGATAFVGATGLDDCTAPGVSPCGPTSASVIGSMGDKYYATDFSNNLYSVNPLTGGASLIGVTGIPALPFVPVLPNPDGSFGFFDEAIFSVGGNLYATFDAATFNPGTSVFTTVVAPALYRIDPTTGIATFIGATDLGLGAVTNVNGTVYAFNDLLGQISTLNLANGQTTFVTTFDPAAGLILGASAAAPEPSTTGAAGLALLAVALYVRSKLTGRLS